MPSVYKFTCINKKVPDKSKYTTLQNVASPIWNLPHVALLAPGIWKSFVDIWKTGGLPGQHYSGLDLQMIYGSAWLDGNSIRLLCPKGRSKLYFTVV